MSTCPYHWDSHGCELDSAHLDDHQCIRMHTPGPPETIPRGHPDVFHYATDKPEPEPRRTE